MTAAVGPVPEHSPPATPAMRLTGRGAIVAIFGFTVLGGIGAELVQRPALAGAGFVIGCALATLLVRQADLVTVAASPPVVFLLATVLVQAFVGSGGGAAGAVRDTIVVLGGTAPWLFAGTALVLALALRRGLLGAIRELRRGSGPAPHDRRIPPPL